MPDVDAATVLERVREAISTFGSRQDPGLLSTAVEQAMVVVDAVRFDQLDAPTRAYALTLAAAAATLRFRTSAAAPDDLDRAIGWTRRAVAAWPPDDPNAARARANLATALSDRFDRDGNPADLDDALDEYEHAIRGLGADGDRVDVALHGQGMLFHDRARLRDDPADLDRAIACFAEALSSRAPKVGERAGYRNSLGLSLRAKGRVTGRPDLLRAADTAFRTAIDEAGPGTPDSVAPTLNLAAVLQDRAEAENDIALLREALEVYRSELPHLDPARRARATANAATALIDLYRYTLDRRLLTEAIRDLRASADTLPDPEARSVALANLAAALHEMYDSTGQIAVLDQAIAIQEELLGPGSRPTERVLNLGVSLLARFRRRRAPEDLDRAIALFEEAYRGATSPVERASALNSQANGTSLRHDLTGALADIDQSVALREQAIRVARLGSIDVALYRANLGVDLLKRFELVGSRADLDRAVDEQRAALRLVPPGSADGPRLLAGLADSLARRSDSDPDGEDAAEARATYRRAVEQGLDVLPEQALAAALRWGTWAAGEGRWPEAAGAYRDGLAVLTRQIARQERRSDKESWLGDAAGLPESAAVAHTRSGDLLGAVATLDSGRAMLLTDALFQRPVTAHAPD